MTLNGRSQGRSAAMAFKSALSENEKILVDHLQHMNCLGYEYTEKHITDLATEFAIALEKKTLNDPRFGDYWYNNFRKRCPDVRPCKPEKLQTVRDKLIKPEIVYAYCDEFTAVLDHPESIFILDELTLTMDRDDNTIVDLDASVEYQPKTFTLIGCGNASGGLVPPYLVLPGKEWNEHYLDGTCNGAGGECSESGVCDPFVMKNYFERHFKKFACVGKNCRPTLILYDGHKTVLPSVLKCWAEQNNVVFFVLPPYLSCVCLFNIGCFAALKDAYSQEGQSLKLQNSKLTTSNVAKVVNNCYLKTMTLAM